MTGAEIHAHMAAELIDANRSYAELTPFAARLFLAGLAALAVALGWRFQARRFDVLDWRVVSFAIVGADALLFKSAHLVLPFTLAAFAWALGIALGAQSRGAIAWFAHHRARRS
jgi:CHASE2 domain-containing sensor protein